MATSWKDAVAAQTISERTSVLGGGQLGRGLEQLCESRPLMALAVGLLVIAMLGIF